MIEARRYEPSEYRDLEPVPLWSTRIQTPLDADTFQQRVREVAHVEGEYWSGFYVEDEHGVAYTSTRYPRQKLGIKSDATCERVAGHLKASLEGQRQPDMPEGGWRVVLGMREGYGQETVEHAPDEVQTYLGSSVAVYAANIYAVTPDLAEPGYTEPVAVINGTDPETLQRVYELATLLQQERFVVEDFHRGTAHIVETTFCQDPD